MEKFAGNPPLVSVIVITYNSSKYLIDTLESIKSQTYGNLELIVSDDCSTDDTLALCRNWLAENGNHFFRTILLSPEKNTGISGNCNRGLNEATGKWVKFLAGDDLLVADCIREFVSFMEANPNVNLVCSGVLPFSHEVFYKEYYPPKEYDGMSAFQQLKKLLKEGTLFPAPATFYKRSLFDELGGCDERYQFVEDFPLFIKLTSAGHKIHILELPLVKYRIYPESVSQNCGDNRFVRDYCLFLDEVVVSMLKEHRIYVYYWHYTLEGFLRKKKDESSFWGNIWVRRILFLFDPIYIKNYLYKILGKDYLSRHNMERL